MTTALKDVSGVPHSPSACGRDDRYDEVWDGVLVMSPGPNNEHQRLVGDLTHALASVVSAAGAGDVYPGLNVSDRDDWTTNYRIPDAAVYLTGNPAIDCGSHYRGGPDFAVEIVSPGEDPDAKLGFYAAVGTRELLVIRRGPWELELYTLAGGELMAAGRSDIASRTVLTSDALGMTFTIVPGTPRPRVEVSHPASRRSWRA